MIVCLHDSYYTFGLYLEKTSGWGNVHKAKMKYF